MPAKKKAAAKTKPVKKASNPSRKAKTSSAPGESAHAHQWLMETQAPEIAGPTEVTVVTDEKASKPWLFKPGNNANPKGRPKGSRSKLAEAFIQDVYADWVEHGASVIAMVRGEKPDVYLKVAASILPKQMDVRVSELAELTDDGLDDRLTMIQQELTAALAILQPTGSA